MPPSTSSLLRKYNLRPRKGLGQNFLDDPVHLAKIVEAAGLSSTDTVLEIGPGLGLLTRRLAQAAGQVIAVELDTILVKLLRAELGHLPNLTIIQADILEYEPEHIGPYKVVANLPYYITSAVLRHLLEEPPRPERIVVTVQLEVARRIVAEPGRMSLLAVSVQLFGRASLVHRIPAGAFYPRPKVDSAVIRIDPFAQPPIPAEGQTHFFRVVRAGFGQKRKQLKNSLAAGLPYAGPEIVAALEQAGIAPTRRAETLSLTEWQRLAALLSGKKSGG